MMEKQVNKDFYSFERYCTKDRWASYHYQLDEIVKTRSSSILEVGVGDRVVENYIKHNTGIAYTSVDIAEDVGADVIASINKLPFENNSFDAVCAFEVLEHLPYETLPSSLSEMARVARNKVLISVPHFSPPLKFLFKIPFLPEIALAFKIPFPLAHEFNGQHYWELGKKGYSAGRFRKHLEDKFVIEKEFIPFENQYHHFFVLSPKK
jgi:hypothetical protein